MTRENLEKLRVIQDEIEQGKEEMKSRKSKFDESNKSLSDAIENLQSQETLYKQGIEAEALKEFKETGKKQLLGGVKIQVKNIKTLTYTPENALKWAKEKDMFLMYDKKGFEKAVDSLPAMDWLDIKKSTENKVTFPKEIKLEEEK